MALLSRFHLIEPAVLMCSWTGTSAAILATCRYREKRVFRPTYGMGFWDEGTRQMMETGLWSETVNVKMSRPESALAKVLHFPDSIAEQSNGPLVCVVDKFRANLYEIISPESLAEIDVDFAEGFTLDDLTAPATSDEQRRLVLLTNTRVDFQGMSNQSVVDLIARGTARGLKTSAYASGRHLIAPMTTAWKAANDRFITKRTFTHSGQIDGLATRIFQNVSEGQQHFNQLVGWAGLDSEDPFNKFWGNSRAVLEK